MKLWPRQNDVRFAPFETILIPFESSRRDLLHCTLHLDTKNQNFVLFGIEILLIKKHLNHYYHIYNNHYYHIIRCKSLIFLLSIGEVADRRIALLFMKNCPARENNQLPWTILPQLFCPAILHHRNGNSSSRGLLSIRILSV